MGFQCLGHLNWIIHIWRETLELNERRPRNNEGQGYDGRGNVNVGRGRFYQRGDDLLVECEFPRRDSLATDIVWYRKTYG